MKKVSIIGAGNVGPTAAFLMALKELADIVLVDSAPGIAEGKALDMMHASIPLGFSSSIIGTTDYSTIKNSKIVIISAGMSRKPGMSRQDLFEKNSEVMKAVCREIKKYEPDTVVIVVTNPLDLMCRVAFNELQFPKSRVMGLSSLLDTSRMKYYALQKGKRGDGTVIGTHDDGMVIVPGKLAEEAGKPEIEEIGEKTRTAGATIVRLSGSSYYGPAACLLVMADSILNDRKKEIPACAYLEGEYGYSGIFLGTPAVLGEKGVERAIELSLTEEEKEKLDKAASRIRELYSALGI